MNTTMDRRQFLGVMGASVALAGMAGCTRLPREWITPYVEAPEETLPGNPLYYASAFPFRGHARPILVESHEGRPTKVDGIGGSDVFMQASILSLYDPERARTVRHLGKISTWDAFVGDLLRKRSEWSASQGEGLRLLTETVTSPTLVAGVTELLRAYPKARWHRYEPVNRDQVHAGSRLAFRNELEPVFHLANARVIVSLDSDFLHGLPESPRLARELIDGRRVRRGGGEMNRLYVAESTATITGAMAEHREAIRPSRVLATARALAGATGVRLDSAPGQASPWVTAAAADLRAARGASVVIAGEHASPAVHALAHAINWVLGNVGRTVTFVPKAEAGEGGQLDSLKALARDMEAGQVSTLIIAGSNPVYSSPADLGFEGLLEKVPTRIQLSQFEDETSARCHWHLPESHPLESWGDLREQDGTVRLMQPLIEPMGESRTASQLLAALIGNPGAQSRDLVRAQWKPRLSGDFETQWKRALQNGRIEGTASHETGVTLDAAAVAALPGEEETKALEVRFMPDPAVWDGRYANNAWLQELPKPLTRLTWGNAVHLSPGTAAGLGVNDGDEVEVRLKGRVVQGAVLIQPGHPDGSVTLPLGYGRTRSGQVGSGHGFNAFAVQDARAPWQDSGLELRRTGRKLELAQTQHHHTMEGRDLARSMSRAELARIKHPAPEPKAFAPRAREGEYAWAMSIDLTACIGCAACVVACQAENNIPVVGKAEVLRGREMHWIRIDRYYRGNPGHPEILFQPVPCMHCEDAPCEVVCPTEAAIHDDEGLNVQVYNRCVGTRYCSNNCPYKVRRFNFFGYADKNVRPGSNPEVTIRSRGVMEKCTYCVQRITRAHIEAGREDRRIRDGEVVPACAVACPTDAIVFGDLNDQQSRVSRLKDEPHDYSLLGELGTRPRTTYLRRVRNPREGA